MEDLVAEESFIKRIKQEYDTEKLKSHNKKDQQNLKMLEHMRATREKRSV